MLLHIIFPHSNGGCCHVKGSLKILYKNAIMKFNKFVEYFLFCPTTLCNTQFNKV